MRHPIAAGQAALRTSIRGGAMLYHAAWARNLEPQWFEPEHWEKHGAIEGSARGRGATWFVRHGSTPLVLRHYRRGGLIARWLGDRYWYTNAEATRPFREWSLTHWCHVRGLPVPEPVAARYVRDGRWYRGDLLTRRIVDVESLAQRLAAGPVSLPRWVAIGRTIGRLHAALVCHADLNAHNILLADDERAYLVDFDRGYVATRRGFWCDANLVRLRRSLEKVTEPLPPGRFTDADWHSLLAGYREALPAPPSA
ncbi:MAG: 3-deoxy-D-manno-octulosonic acid kinase [Gammaproteobacteria bacterium]|nr:3-deoxy-D-manno-octulosonic acid kinase [Gammaproteobacteria bacterium]